MIFKIPAIMLLGALLSFNNCNKTKVEPPPVVVVVPPKPINNPIAIWTTSADESSLLATSSIDFAKAKDDKFKVITVDSTQKFQTIDGFGYTLTGGSATLINQLSINAKEALLQELFSTKDKGIGLSYLRISMGASDLSASVFSYDDVLNGETDIPLAKFNLAQDTIDLIPILKKILAINPNLKILATPWSAPIWMKTNNSSIGGNLTPQYYGVYARYFVKYIEQMKANGIPIDAVTLQNEPEHGGNNPSMLVSPTQAIDFVKNHLGPAFKAANITTKIIVWDHNCDNPNYPITILNDPAAKAFINGSAFHLYAGNINALSQVYAAHRDKDLYFTEQWTGSKGDFAGDFKWHIKNVMLGSMRNRSRVALEWNLANDAAFAPHTPGGCTECKGALTIQNANITRNVAYYIIAQLSKFVPAGSVRIASDDIGALQTVAFKTPDNKTVLVLFNEGNAAESFNINYHGKWIVNSIAAGTAATYIW
jgi:glucosylceramidase